MNTTDYLNVNQLRINAMNMINGANSGHPGIALDFAPALYVLYKNHLKGSYQKHLLRDRFVLSAGHGSALLYSVLNAFGYDVSTEQLKNFRQLDSITPGHPEVGLTDGVDASTGPLGQGLSYAVGMALAEKMMAERFNKPDVKLFDNYTYVALGDGCLMEGISHEVLGFAGSLRLNKLIVLYDSNKCTIEGDTSNVFNQDTISIMQGYGFNTIVVKDGNDLEEIDKAIVKAKSSNKPTFIEIKTTIGYGSSLAGNAKVHGSPLGDQGLKQLMQNLNFTGKPFTWTREQLSELKPTQINTKINDKYWDKMLNNYAKFYPNEYEQLTLMLSKDFGDIADVVKQYNLTKETSTRAVGGDLINLIANHYNQVVGGTADVASSVKAFVNSSKVVTANDFSGQNVQFGVREFGMAGIVNGIALYGAFTPFCGCFLVFSDYMKNAIRMSALMNLPVRYIFSHDSICAGEDGATHHPVEQLSMLRGIPNINVWRPCDVNECKASYANAFGELKPSAIILTRQNVKTLNSSVSGASKGAYVIYKENKPQIDCILLASGSEVQLAVETADELSSRGYNIRVVSVPCMEVFNEQSAIYRNSVLPSDVKARVAVELSSSSDWYRYVGLDGDVLAMNEFGTSAPYAQLLEKFGFTVENLCRVVIKNIKKNK